MADQPSADPRVAEVHTAIAADPVAADAQYPSLDGLDAEIAKQRGTLQALFAPIVERLQGVTGMYPGSGAQRLVDEFTNYAVHELPRFLFLRHAEQAVHVDPPVDAAAPPGDAAAQPPTPPEAETRAVLRGFDSPAKLVTWLDEHPAEERPSLARALLRFAEEEGTPFEVLTAIRAFAAGADDPLGEGAIVAVFGQDVSLPSPGELVELGDANAVPPGRYKVIGFGVEPQTVRVRPPRPDELPDVDAAGQAGSTDSYKTS